MPVEANEDGVAWTKPKLRNTPSLDWMDIGTLEFSKRRLSKENERQHRQLMASIAKFGFITAIVVKGREVVVGEARLRAALELGVERVPAVDVGHLNAAEVRQFRIADNRLAELREWDPIALRAEFDEIIVLEPDLNIEAMGYEIPEFDIALQSPADAIDPDDGPVPVSETTFSRPGDVWEIDGHAIMCGDARSRTDWRAILGGKSPAVIIADPPWNCPVKSHMGGKGAIQHPEFVMASGEMSDAEFLGFQRDWLACACEYSVPGGLLYVASDWRALHATTEAAHSCDLEQINLCVWRKTPGMGSMYRSAHELFLVLRKSGAQHQNNIRLGAYGRFRSNCWDYPGASSFGIGREALAIHPTAKPVALLRDIFLDCTRRGDVVVDPFSGSGSTLIAAQRTGRAARVIELDPRYVDAAVRRYEQVFGRAPRLRSSGLTFKELQAERTTDAPRDKRPATKTDDLSHSASVARARKRRSQTGAKRDKGKAV